MSQICLSGGSVFSLYPTCVVVDIFLLVLLGSHIKGFIEYHNYMYKFSTNIIFAVFEDACTYALQKLKLLN